MAKKKVKHFKTDSQDKPVMRADNLDLNNRVKYADLRNVHKDDSQDYEELTNLIKTNPIARKIVYKPAEDATRNGFRLVIPDNAALQAKYQKKLDDLKLQAALTQQLAFRAAHGDGYITVGIMEKNATSPDTPVNPSNILDVTFIHAFGQNHIKDYATNDDPTSKDYGKEEAIIILPKESGYTVDKNGNVTPNPPKTDPIVVDKSRYWHISLDKYDDDTTGYSILSRCEEQLKVMDIALSSVGKMLREFTFKVFKSDRLMTEEQHKFEQDKAEISRIMNTESTAFISNDDDLVKLSTQTNGVNVLLDFAWQNLAAACNIPKSVLTGEQAGTLAGATQDVINYYDTVKSMQYQLLKPGIEGIVRLLMYADDVADGYLDPESIDWHIEFNPLWTPDGKTQAEIQQLQVNSATALVTSGIIGTDEAKNMLSGQGNNSVQGMQTMNTDSAEEFESKFTDEQVKQYYKDLEKAHSDD